MDDEMEDEKIAAIHIPNWSFCPSAQKDRQSHVMNGIQERQFTSKGYIQQMEFNGWIGSAGSLTRCGEMS